MNETEDTVNKIRHLLNYCVIHPESTIRYKHSDIQIYKYMVIYPTCQNNNQEAGRKVLYLRPKLKIR